MKKPPQQPPKLSNPVPANRAYEDHLPAAVPDAHESNSESVWAMFQESIIDTEERVAVAAELAAAKAKDDAASVRDLPAKDNSDASERETGFAATNFAATNFSDLPSELSSDLAYDATTPSPLKPDAK